MPTTGVITAAGRSSRMAPDHKLVMDLHGKPLIVRSLESLLPFCESVIIVIGAYPQEIIEATQGFPQVRLVHNHEDHIDLYSSVKTGLREVGHGDVLFLPGDCPFSRPDLIRKMIASEGDVIVPSYKGKTGHPVLFSEKAVHEILSDHTLLNLRQYLKKKPLTLVNSKDETILWDIDTHSDLHKARLFFEKLEGE